LIPSDDTTKARRERIVVLLENYTDVEAGLRDRKGDAEHLPLMCKAWNHQSYRELDRLLGAMKDEQHRLYWHLAEMYFRSLKRHVLVCPKCGVLPTWGSKNFQNIQVGEPHRIHHKHGHSNVAVVPRVVRVVRAEVRTQSVEDAIDWLEANWRGSVFVPDELLPAVA